MKVEVRMFMNFKKYLPADSLDGKAMISLEEGSTLEDLLKILNIPVNEPKIIVVNGISKGISAKVSDQLLKEGDIVSIFPPVAGG
jgi:molybdopterin converting factor small subunit